MITLKQYFAKFMEVGIFGDQPDDIIREKIKRTFYTGAFTVCRNLIDAESPESALELLEQFIDELEQFIDELSEYHIAGMPLDEDEKNFNH